MRFHNFKRASVLNNRSFFSNMSTVQHPEISFYIALLSDSGIQYFLENTLSGFITKIPHEVVLDGVWESGISEVRYPLTFFNILDNATLIKAQNTIRQHTLPVLSGFYTTSDVVKKITGFISEDSGEVKVDNHTGKIIVITGNLPIYMSPALYNFLGHYFEPKN